MTNMTTALHYGDPVTITHPDLSEPAHAKYVGYTGGTTYMVELEGTYQFVHVPKPWVRKEELGHKGRSWSGR